MAPRTASRERKERFIKSFGDLPMTTAISEVTKHLLRHGLSWLTDEQISDVTSSRLDSARISQRLRIRNRKVLSGRAA
jgi:hypothetical protein